LLEPEKSSKNLCWKSEAKFLVVQAVKIAKDVNINKLQCAKIIKSSIMAHYQTDLEHFYIIR
jgi:hypothetical protein